MIYCAQTVDDFGEGPEAFFFVSLDGESWLEVDREPKPDMRPAIKTLFTTETKVDPKTGEEYTEGHIRMSRRWLRQHNADFWTLEEK